MRRARPGELGLLVPIERSADTRFPTGAGPMPGPADLEEFEGALVVLVAGDPPVGFARLERVGDQPHLEQVSVLPDRGRRGVGRDLVEGACRWAADRGHRRMTLMTYRDVAWNGPFYRSLGFAEVAATTPALRALVAADARTMAHLVGLGPRVLMARRLDGPARGGGSSR